MNKILKQTGSLAFFIAVFLNAFVDLGHKIIIQNTVFKLYEGSHQILLTAFVNALILLPFILLMSPAGFLSDRFRKTDVMRKAAWVVVLGSCVITVCYYQGWFWPAFFMTFLLAAQSAIYSPAKYGFIKEFFGKAKLGEVNGIVAALSIVAILAGTFAYSVGFEMLFPADATTEKEVLQAIAPVGWLLIASSLFELFAMYKIPQSTETNDFENFEWRRFIKGQQIKDNLLPLKQSQAIRLSVIGLATFWAVGQVMLATFPAFLKDNIGVDNTIVVQGVVACAGIGIALGSMFAGRFSRNYIETGLLPIGALGLAIGLLFLPHLESTYWAAGLFLFIGFCGGIFIVPLNAMIQFFAEEKALGRTLAASNWVQNITMLLFLVVTALFSVQGWESKSLLQLIALVALIGSFYTVYQLPQSLTRFILSTLINSVYRIKVLGMKNIPAKGGVLLLGNHVSWIDWAIIQIASPRPVRFVMANRIYQRWYVKPLFDLFGCIPIKAGASSRQALETVSESLDNEEVVCLFPEGVISHNGHLAEFKKGYEKACAVVNSKVVIVPFYLRGLWGSKFSRSSTHLKQTSSKGAIRDIIIGFGETLSKDTTAEILKQKVLELSTSSWDEYTTTLPGLGEKWIETSSKSGNPTVIVDGVGTTLSAKAALTGSIVLARRIKKLSREKNIGIILPASAGSMLCNMACMLLGKTAVNVNFTASKDSIISAIEQAEIKTIYTSKRFLKKLQGKGLDLDYLSQHSNLVMIEETVESSSKFEKASILLSTFILPTSVLKRLYCKVIDIEVPAVILFSSGSEGSPKGVVLSHKNIMANVKQITEMLNMDEEDVILSNLPPFHAFGLTATLFLPLLERVPAVCHADPTAVLVTAKSIAEHKITTMFGTSSFFRLYVRNSKVHPLMLQSLRLIVAGAEKLQEDVRSQFQLKFSKNILQGYGATETSPVASVNLMDIMNFDTWKVQQGNKVGSVGMSLPGTSFRIVDPDNLQPLPCAESGMILISGPQVMKGYLNNEELTNKALKVIDDIQWYITGDKGYLDKDGFLFVEDRYSRFAKISGEMVSLSLVETTLLSVIDDAGIEILAVNIPDEKKGESIILLSNQVINESDLREKLVQIGFNTLAFPSTYITVDEIPKLGSGKTDFKTAKTIALSGNLNSMDENK